MTRGIEGSAMGRYSLTLCAVLVLSGTVVRESSCADLSAATASALTPANSESSRADAVQDLLYLTPRRPLLIRLHLYSNNEGFRAPRQARADASFRTLDVDGNGIIEGSELAAMRLPADSAPLGEKISLENYRSQLLRGAGNPFFIRTSDTPGNRRVFANPEDQGAQVNLFPKLDSDQDGRLSKKELETAAANLRRYDRNEDDIVDNGELSLALPEEVAASQQKLAGALGMLMVVDSDDGGTTLYRRLLETYDKAARDPVSKTFRRDERLSPSEMPLEPEVFAVADRNGDGKLDRNELASLSQSMIPAIELEVRVPSRDGRDMITLFRSSADATITSSISIELTNKSNLIMKLGDTSIELRAEGPSSVTQRRDPTRALRQVYIQRFKSLDRDQNEYLDSAELQNAGFPATFLTQADSDGNAKVFEKEYAAQVDREIEVSKTDYAWEFTNSGASLFRLVDVSPADGRLSLRELADAPAKLLKLDANGDGYLSLNELSITLVGTFKSGIPRVNGPFNPQFQNSPALNRGTRLNNAMPAQPEWFRKMDRNRDGDLSPKEFLGRRILFDKIDKDHDGLVSPKEAEEATAEATKQAPKTE